LFVEHSPASIAMFDNQMCYLVASRRFLADYHLGNLNVEGRSHYEVFPEISERWKEFHRRGLAGETLKEDNDPFPRADGKTDWVRWEIRPWYESKNQIGGIILFSEVITAQVEDREALRESDKYNRMLFEQSVIGLALTSFDGKLIDINTTYANIIGRTIDEAKALTYWEITPKKYDVQEKIQLELLEKIGSYGPYEKEYIHKNGHLVPVRLQGLIVERNKEKYIWSSVEDITQSKQAEQLLLKSEENYRTIFELSPVAAAFWDREANIIFWNKSAETIFGWSKDEVIGKKFTEFFVPESSRKYVEENIDLLINSISRETTINENLRKDGTAILCEWHNTIIYDKDGNPATIISMAKDVTEQKRTEEKLKNSEQEFRSLAESMPQIVWATTADGLNVYFNQQWVDYTGMTMEESYGHGWSKPFHPDDQQAAWNAWQNAVNNNSTYSIEARLRRFDGEYRWWLVRGIPQINEQGEIQKWFGTCTDIEEIKNAEVALRISETRHRLLFEHSLDAMAYHRILFENDKPVDLIYLDVNQAFEIQTGLKNAVGKKASELIPGLHQTNPELLERYLQVAITGQPLQYETYIIPTKTWYFTSLYSLSKDTVVSVFKNITESKQAEKEIRKQLDELRRWYNVTLDREGRVLELKQEVNELLMQHGEALRYGNTIPENPDGETKV